MQLALLLVATPEAAAELFGVEGWPLRTVEWFALVAADAVG